MREVEESVTFTKNHDIQMIQQIYIGSYRYRRVVRAHESYVLLDNRNGRIGVMSQDFHVAYINGFEQCALGYDLFGGE